MEPELTHVYMGDVLKYDETPEGLMVVGKAASSTLDMDQQRCDPNWLKSAMPDWYQWGNVREQHSSIAAGVGRELTEGAKSGDWSLKSLVVDQNTQAKVRAGVLKGYSIGIKGTRVMNTPDAPKGKIVGGKIVEVSLVDRPANPDCRISLATKSEGDTALMPVNAGDVIWVDEEHATMKAVTLDSPETTDDTKALETETEVVLDTQDETLRDEDLFEESIARGTMKAVRLTHIPSGVQVTGADTDTAKAALADAVKADAERRAERDAKEQVKAATPDADVEVVEPDATKADSTDDSKDCSTCKGSGKIKGGSTKCPDCGGSGNASDSDKAVEADDEKSGRAISKARLEKITAAQQALADVVASVSVEPAPETEATPVEDADKTTTPDPDHLNEFAVQVSTLDASSEDFLTRLGEVRATARDEKFEGIERALPDAVLELDVDDEEFDTKFEKVQEVAKTLVPEAPEVVKPTISSVKQSILDAMATNKDAGEPVHDPAILASVRDNLAQLMQAELDELMAGEPEIGDLYDLLATLSSFLQWWCSEAWAGEDPSPYETPDGGPQEDVMIWTGLGVSPDTIKAAEADDLSEEDRATAQAALREEVQKALGLDTLRDFDESQKTAIADTAKAAVTEAIDEFKTTVEDRLQTVEKLAAPGGPVRGRSREETQKATRRDELVVEIGVLEKSANNATDHDLRDGYRQMVATKKSELAKLDS